MKLAGGCLAVAVIIWIAWLVFLWWLVGILVDWANSYFHLGLPGIVAFAFHVVTFLVIGGLSGKASQRATSD